jgi:hypothetical protein
MKVGYRKEATGVRAMKAEKIEIEGATEVPLIKGCNFFTGEFVDKGMSLLSGGVSQREWDFYWRRFTGAPPPGTLPEGALVMMYAGGNGGQPTLMQPQKVSLKDDIADVHWRFTETDEGKLSYSILIVPGKVLNPHIETVSVPMAVQAINAGAEEKVTVMPALKFRRNHSFLRL